MKCVTCKFFDSIEGPLEPGDIDDGEVPTSGYGYCRRYPPFVHSTPEAHYDYPGTEVMCWIRPTMKGDDWCGEWKDA